jgi:hypothetical protein
MSAGGGWCETGMTVANANAFHHFELSGYEEK